jgi:hypothetical protein
VEIRCERWEVTPLASPRLIRHCPGCNETRPFVCAGTFRVNAHRKRLDVWLNYRCERCDAAWKCPVIERQPVAEIEPQRLEAFFRDDPLLAHRLAFDIVKTQRAPIDATTEVHVKRLTVAPTIDDLAPLCIRLAVPLPCNVRLDRLLAQQLRMSRAALQEFDRRGDLRVWPPRDRALRTTIRNGQCIRLWAMPVS